VLKKSVEPYLSNEVIYRPKMGFSPPLAMWFRTALKETFDAMVLNRDMEEFICPVEARRLWNEHQSGLANHDRKLWNLLMLGCWQSTHVAQREIAFEGAGRAG